MPNNFKPAISSLIPFDELPEIIGQLEQAQDLFDKLYYNNLNVNHSTQGDAGFYSMDLSVIQSQELALAVPGVDGMRVLLNPSTGGGFPFTLSYKLGILKYIKDFSISSFPKTVPAYFDLLLSISGIEENELLSAYIFGFIDDEDPIQKFINNYNTKHSPTPALNKGTSLDEDEQIDNIINLLSYSNKSVSEVILNDFVNTDNDSKAGLEKLVNLF